MAELIDIKRVCIGPENMTALVRLSDDAPVMTSDDLEGTARVYRLMPHIVEHACIGDAGETFREAMGNTEVAHLLEHVTVELLAQTDLAGDMPAGRTWVDEVDDRTYQIELACPDDVLVAAALSCGVWVLDWAYTGGLDPEPDVDAIVAGLVQLVQNIGDEGEDLVIDYAPEPLDDEEPDDEDETWDEDDESEYDEDDEESEYDEDDDEEYYEDDEDSEYDEDEDDEPGDDENEDNEEELEDDEPEPEPERPLWTEAPEVSAPLTRSPHPVVTEDEVDQIMATIERPAPLFDEADKI